MVRCEIRDGRKTTNLSEVVINFVVSVDMQYPYR